MPLDPQLGQLAEGQSGLSAHGAKQMPLAGSQLGKSGSRQSVFVVQAPKQVPGGSSQLGNAGGQGVPGHGP